jgi:hypothetical protein
MVDQNARRGMTAAGVLLLVERAATLDRGERVTRSS